MTAERVGTSWRSMRMRSCGDRSGRSVTTRVSAARRVVEALEQAAAALEGLALDIAVHRQAVGELLEVDVCASNSGPSTQA